MAAIFGVGASHIRFLDRLVLNLPDTALYGAKLMVERGPAPSAEKPDWQASRRTGAQSATAPSRFQEIPRLSDPVGDPAHQLAHDFKERLKAMPMSESRRLLEIGARARSGVVRRDYSPDDWEYSGFDVLDGPNVDVVGDAHELSSYYPCAHFDGVMAISVLEHILMPWKLAIEMNRVLKLGGIGLLFTHQCWPLHDQPWDFWRFSDEAWKSLFNPATGFEILAAKMGEPAHIVSTKMHPATAFGDAPAGHLASAVLFRKTAQTRLEWPVSVAEVLDTQYPSSMTAIQKI